MAQHNKRQPGPIRRTIVTDQTSRTCDPRLFASADAGIRSVGYARKTPKPRKAGGPNEWATVSQNYRTAATVDRRWDATVSQVSR